MPSAVDRILQSFPTAKRTGKQWLARCPSHEDRKASLAISEGEGGKALLHCHAGCSIDSILHALSLDESALFPDVSPRQTSTIDCVYDYHDATGRLLYQVVRFEPKDFRQRRPDGAGGWIWNLKDTPRVPYRLNELQHKQSILIVEGEKDADRAWALGVPATTNPGGAEKWTDDLSAHLKQAGVLKVAITPDNDPVGRQHGEIVAASCRRAGLIVLWLALPDIPQKGDLSDYLNQGHTREDLVALCRAAPQWDAQQIHLSPAPQLRQFQRQPDGRYTYMVLPPGVSFELDRLSRGREGWNGELCVRCDLAGVSLTTNGALFTADFNLTSGRGRTERANILKALSKTNGEIDWLAMLGEFCERVLESERIGEPSIRLIDYEPPTHPQSILIDGLLLLHDDPVILYGDQATGKSYLALYLAGRLMAEGYRVLYADWEGLPRELHRRFRLLFGMNAPDLRYVDCNMGGSLRDQRERLSKIIKQEQITYVVIDSIGYACGDVLEAANVATSYFQAARTLGVGSLHIAHVPKLEQPKQDPKPFGSQFFMNSARGVWYCRAAEAQTPESLAIGLYHKKNSFGGKLKGTAFTFQFEANRTVVVPHDIEQIPELASGLPLWQRMRKELEEGPRTLAELSKELDAKVETVSKAARRHTNLFEKTLDATGVQRLRLVHSG